MIKPLAILFLTLLPTTKVESLYFGIEKAGNDWQIVNDGVMGGRSISAKKLTSHSLVFSGTVSLENNGGFASIRAPYGEYDLSKFEEIEIKYRAKGQAAALTFDKDYRFYIPNYRLKLEQTDTWKIEKIKLLELNECYLGEPNGNKLTKKIAKSIIRMGFIVANKKAGSFELEVAYLKFK